jgi:hypothetical protein
MRLRGKVAIVTGGAHGMGEAEARLFAKEGAQVVVADILAADAEKVAADIRAGGGEAIAAAIDVTREADWQVLIGKTLAAYGRLDHLATFTISPNQRILPWRLYHNGHRLSIRTIVKGKFQVVTVNEKRRLGPSERIQLTDGANRHQYSLFTDLVLFIRSRQPDHILLRWA